MGRINSTEEFEERLRKTGGSQDKYEWRELFYDWREFVKTPEHHEEAMQYMKENRPYIDIMYMSCGFSRRVTMPTIRIEDHSDITRQTR